MVKNSPAKQLRWYIRDQFGVDSSIEGAEIGVGCAATSIRLLEWFDGMRLWLVDSWSPMRRWDGRPKGRSREQMLLWRQLALENLLPYRGRYAILEMISDEASSWIGDERLDFAFIDAEHTAPSVRTDIKNWWPKVKPHGLLLGHDYGGKYVEVAEAVDDFVVANEGLRLDVGVNSVWRVEKLGRAP